MRLFNSICSRRAYWVMLSSYDCMNLPAWLELVCYPFLLYFFVSYCCRYSTCWFDKFCYCIILLLEFLCFLWLESWFLFLNVLSVLLLWLEAWWSNAAAECCLAWRFKPSSLLPLICGCREFYESWFYSRGDVWYDVRESNRIAPVVASLYLGGFSLNVVCFDF